MGEVERINTIMGEDELAWALMRAFEDGHGRLPVVGELALLWAHNALECGRDGMGKIVHCRCWNLGNLTVSAVEFKAGADYWALKCMEQQRDCTGALTGQWKLTTMHFHAFRTLELGAQHYIEFLNQRGYAHAMAGVYSLGARAFGQGLAQDRYMTANPDTYTRALMALQQDGYMRAAEALDLRNAQPGAAAAVLQVVEQQVRAVMNTKPDPEEA